jgi:2-aminoadipate transaminase
MSAEPMIATARWTRALTRSAMQDMLELTARPGLLSMALGLPAAELFPTAGLAVALERVLAEDPRALQYEPPSERLKQHVVALMARRGVQCDASQVFITAGAQQGMNLLGRLLLDPGAAVVVEERAYPGFLQVIEPFEPRILTVPSDLQTGMDVDAVATLLAHGERPALIYAITDGHNPLGVGLSREKRARLVELSRRYGVPILEDDAYGFLTYEEAAPPMRALDAEQVYYIGSFSKLLAPALRVGWMVVPEALRHGLSAIKEATDINTATLAQRAVAAYLDSGALDEHLGLIRREYRARRDQLLRSLTAHFPAAARWSTPSAGMFVWVELAPSVDTLTLLRRAVEQHGVAFVPSAAFAVPGGPRSSHGMRLNFSNPPPARIEEGVARLAAALADR